MTREEAIDIFEHNWTRLENHDYTENELNEALDMAIKALEQEPVLDKIRAEIIEMTSHRGFLSCETSAIHKDINAVFDKYKGESEEVNGR